MFKKVRSGLGLAFAVAIVAIVIWAIPVLAAPPNNDNFQDATEILGLPFEDHLNTTEATVGDDPWLYCYGAPQATVWYKYTSTEYKKLDALTDGSSYTTVTGVYIDQDWGLESIACAYNSTATFYTDPGTTYYIMISATEGSYPYPGDDYGGELDFTLQEHQLVPPEVGFDFYMSGALEYQFWSYSWDPEGFGIESADWEFGDGSTSTDWDPIHKFDAEGDYDVTLTMTTYDGRTASVTRTVNAFLPQPEANFYFNPNDPSTFDLIEFYNYSNDPANEEMTAYWDFGDGSTSEEWSPYHQYDFDGDYQVMLTIATEDGRSDSTSREVTVETHDVAINQFTVPRTGKVGLTRHLEVGISNTLQPEDVRVTLYKSGGTDPWNVWEQVGSLTQYVAVQDKILTTKFIFTYTFTEEDGEDGKINFKVEAQILNVNKDAYPGDNTVISLPVRIRP